MGTWLPRALGVVTAAYGTAVAIKPDVLARPIGLTDGSRTAPGIAVVCRAVGARDLVSGMCMATARSTPALRNAITVRVAADVGDALVFGTHLPNKDVRGKASAIALSWGVVCGLSALALRRR